MKTLQILGTGCPTCNKLAEMTRQAATELGLDFELEKVTQIDRILSFDVPGTPALVVDGIVRSAGRLPSMAELKTLIT